MTVYLDHAATTTPRRAAVDEMVRRMTESVGNPSGAHRAARDARRAIDDARDVFAKALACEPGDIVFTSGGTESDNLAVLGSSARAEAVVCSAVEHAAVLEPVRRLGGRIVPVDRNGVIELDALAQSLDPSVQFVSVMAANNETGTMQPIRRIAEIVRAESPDAILHSDAVQAAAFLDLTDIAAAVDALSLSAHKFGGPQGVGVLMVRAGTQLAARQIGGGQERGVRSGTQNVAGIAAAAVAMAETIAERPTAAARVEALRDRLRDGLIDAVPELHTTVDPTTPILPNVCHLCAVGIESESALFMLEKRGVYAAAASSCSSGAANPSHVLAAMGVPEADAHGALRLSLGHDTTDDDIDTALEVVPEVFARLRDFG